MKEKVLAYFTFHFLLYTLRWVLSAFVMMFPLFILHELISSQNEYLNLILIQIVGAFIFYHLDDHLFSKK